MMRFHDFVQNYWRPPEKEEDEEGYWNLNLDQDELKKEPD